MEIRDYLHILAKRWQLVAGVLLTCLAATVGITFAMPETYQAEAQLFVSVQGRSGDVSALHEGSSFAQQQVKSYAQLATSPMVTGPVAKQLGFGLTPQALAEKVSAEAPVETVLINIRATDSSPQQAAKIANAMGNRLATVVEKLEAPPPASGSLVQVNVVHEASPPATPESPEPLLNLALGLLTGLALGFGLAVLVEALDTSVKTTADLAAVTDLPVLGTIARDVTHERRMEAFRQLRTNLRFKGVDHKPRLITVTSAVRGEGKTTVARDLAVTLAQVGQRVCLVDSDLRNPHVAKHMGLVGETGLTNVLIGHAAVDEVVQQSDTRLDVLASGPVPPNPSELLASQRMEHLMQDLLGRYDMVIIDTPPLLPVTDGAVLTSQADGALLVVRAGKTSRTQAVQAVESLRTVDARVLGAVLNMAPGKGGDGHSYGDGHRLETARQYESREQDVSIASAGNGYPASFATRSRPRDSAAATQTESENANTAENGTRP